ncbi:MAG: baseplate protein [Geobacter sp.]|nr:baseplate protein [Geobacter sp.]
MTTALTDITATDWSPRLGEIGQVVTDLDDISQCIRIILETPTGSRAHEPLFGSDLWRYVDYPVREAIPHVIREAIDAITLWEPRAMLISVKPVLTEAVNGRLKVQVEWAMKEYASDVQQTEVTL